MKKKIALCIILFCCLYYFLGGCDNRSESEKLTHTALYKSLISLKSRYGLQFSGSSVGAKGNLYNHLGLNFKIFRILTKDEGRKILIEGVTEMLREINTVPELQPFLNPAPFTPANIGLTIIAYQPDEEIVYYPNILVFSAYKGKLRYKTKIPEQKFGYYTEEEETYEEALNIVRSQEAAKSSHSLNPKSDSKM